MAVTRYAANVGIRQPPLAMNCVVVAKSKAFIRPACSIVAATAILRTSSPRSVRGDEADVVRLPVSVVDMAITLNAGRALNDLVVTVVNTQ
ncbi:hypothetical protein TUM20985_12990 [Mycobacterium antarcticum]|nr:hypothetical protein TUM20985_12990 [Mycolicibacterium sp. TUM20985]GLP74116.1 hypothetical protein TUM20983_12260 [Mycolicibacterium sp. TUM20983]GLP79900.1 hypothetical protein TUM20984_13200 [Mycolicibacterium sp. TUM20984]